MASALTLFSTSTGRPSSRRSVAPSGTWFQPSVRRVDDAVALAVDGAGHADADAEQAGAVAAGDEAVEQQR